MLPLSAAEAASPLSAAEAASPLSAAEARSPLSRLTSPLKRYLDVRVEEHVSQRLDALSAQIEDVRTTVVDTRRLVTDDLDASNEAATLIGRQLRDLVDAVEQLRADVAGMRRSQA